VHTRISPLQNRRESRQRAVDHGQSKVIPNLCRQFATFDFGTYAKRTGNCVHLNGNGISSALTGIRGNSTSTPFWLPVNPTASLMWRDIDLTQSLVPLQSFGTFRFRNNIIGAPTFSSKLCWSMPGSSWDSRNSSLSSSFSLPRSVVLFEVLTNYFSTIIVVKN